MPQAAGLQAPQVSADDPLLAIENLRVVFGPRGREQVAVDDVTLTLAPGEVTARFGDRFEINRIAGQQHLPGWPRGWATYLMTRLNT